MKYKELHIRFTDASGNIKNLTYDLLGHKLTENDFHAPADSTFSHWTYAYDANGNITSVTDAKNQTSNYTYDELDRPLTEDFTGQAGTEVTYVYDTAPNGKGRPASITTLANSVPVITKAFEYDLLGHVTKETRTINATPYITQTEYDLAGNPKRIIYPDAAHTEELSLYNNAGQLEKVQKKQGTTTADLVTNFDYAETGAPKVIAYANGVTTTQTYDITYLYYLTRKQTVKGATKLQDISYSFDLTGNISQITDASQTDAAKTVAYTYDGLSRLLTATATNAANGQNYTQTFAYDILGNITNKSDVGAYTYAQTNYASPQAVTAAGGNTYSYDNNGNLSGDGTWTHAFDYKDRLLSSTKTEATVTYSYDEGGTRVTKKNTTSGKTTTYVNDLLDIEGTTEKLSFYARDLKLATLENTPTPTLSFNHTDHLSGASVDTDTAGNVLQLTDYYPYGDSRIESTTTAFHNDYTFTGKERDEDMTLLYYEARYYDSHLGRFISLDPLFGNIADPQSLNKYSYVRNNPLKYVDPDGKVAQLILAPLLDMGAEAVVQTIFVFGAVLIDFISTQDDKPIESFPIDSAPKTPSHTGKTAPDAVPQSTVPPSPAGPAEEGTIRITPIIPPAPNILTNPALDPTAPTTGCGANMSCERIRDSGLRALPDDEISRRARDKSLAPQERQRYFKEEKARGIRNQQKRQPDGKNKNKQTGGNQGNNGRPN